MTNGVGPMRYVKNHMNYSLWSGKRTYKQPDDYDRYGNLVATGEELEEDGMLAFATANQQVLVTNWNAGQQEPSGSDMAKMGQTCNDFAPFLFKHKIPESVQ